MEITRKKEIKDIYKPFEIIIKVEREDDFKLLEVISSLNITIPERVDDFFQDSDKEKFNTLCEYFLQNLNKSLYDNNN